MRGPGAMVPLSAFPALVLNADYQPLSYYPLSLWGWQDTVKAIFLDRVAVVSHYDRVIRSPGLRVPAAQRGGAEAVHPAGPPAALHAVQRVPARPLRLPVLPHARTPRRS